MRRPPAGLAGPRRTCRTCTTSTGTPRWRAAEEGYYWPTGINYTAALRNDSDWPVIYNLSIGTF